MRRREDPRLVTGRGRFVGDVAAEGCLHAVFVRSPLAHALIRDVDLQAARARPGVIGAHAADDLGLPARLTFGLMPEAFARPPLAVEAVRFAGEAVAVVVAESLAQAVDAAEAVGVDYAPLPVVVAARDAAAEAAPVLFPDHGTNLAFEVAYGGDEDVLAGADTVVRASFVNQRLAAVPMEPDAVLAIPDGDALTIWASTQSPFQVRDFVADCLGLREADVRCIAPDVGGGFGAKLSVVPEQAVVAALARRHGRPVRWAQTRTECFMAMAQGRDQAQEVELGATGRGELTGLRVRVTANVGAYAGLGGFLPFLTGQMLSGVYRIPRIDYAARCYVTNTAPVSAYRGAGRPEAASLVERAMDMLSADLGIDPAELRRRNLIPADAFPYTTATGATYDSGDYAGTLDRALELADYEAVRSEQRRRREAGERRRLGVGLSTYVEITSAGSPTEMGSVELTADGAFVVRAGTASHGQGHETMYAQIAADTLGVPLEGVLVVQADTGQVPRGDGTSGSRSVQLGGSAVLEAGRALLEQAREFAAEVLEASAEDIVAVDGRLGVRGVPGSGLSWAALATAASERGRPQLRADHDVFAEPTYPFGAHIAVVEVDLDTGSAELRRHVAVDDCGVQVNPLLVEGQVHGGVAQGAAQALYEEVAYDAEGTPLTSSLLDYALPTANELPDVETATTVTPSPNNPLGAKGIGESGTIGSTPAVQNAVVDALAHLGVRHLDMPLTPERIWRAIRDATPPR